MTAKSLLVDTNVLIHHWDGDARTTPLLEDTMRPVSFVTEIGNTRLSWLHGP
ncbi:MAG: hypothetical protein IPM68_18000 [Flavobacteriales bacterium]|nr:hypothetical protein [Flavobacteriales bacterium]